MLHRLKTLAAAAFVWLGCSAALAAESESAPLQPIALKCNKAFFEKYNYTWTSKDGVEHVSNLTERATEPEQIKAMITLIYTNPDFPGKKYSSPVAGDDDNCGAVNYARTVPSWNFTNTTPPTNDDEEQTMLVVEVKDSYPTDGATKYPGDNVCQLMYKYIKSVKVITNGFRIKQEGKEYDSSNDTYNPGVVYNVSGTYNRFFVMGKGAYARGNVGEPPFHQMFEEFSPTALAGAGTTPNNFYQRVNRGELFQVNHECTSVPVNAGHWVTMGTGSSDAGQTMSNLNVFIPDFRFINWNLRHNNGHYSSYNPLYRPQFNAYSIVLSAQATQKGAADDHQFDVTLNWTSGLDTLSGSKVEQDFYIYRVVNGVADTKPMNSEPLHGYTYTYVEPQNPSGRGITYIITGKPTGVEYNHVESNKASVIIPGWDPYERLSLNIGGSYSSTYNVAKEENQYKNNITLNNTVGTNVTGDLIEDNATEFVLYRISDDASTPIATIKFGTATATDSCCNFAYTLTRTNQLTATEPVSGVFTAPSRNGELNFGNFSVDDEFTASTAKNDHKAYYDYKVMFKPAKAIAGEELKDVYSNVVRFNVYKTTYTAALTHYTESEYMADTDHSLSLDKNVTVTVTTENAVEVRSYAMYHQDDGGTVKFADIQRAKNGTYSWLVRNTENDNLDLSIADNQPAGTATVYDDLRQAKYNEGTFYPIISAVAPDSTTNTYGANKTTLDLLGVQLSAVQTLKTNPFAYDAHSWKMGFSSEFQAMGKFNSNLMEPVAFRVWRVNSNGTETMLTSDLYKANSNPNVRDNYLFAETAPGELEVKDLFIDNVLKSNETKTVNYRVRFYCRGTGNNSANYYVAERKFAVQFNQGTITGINSVSAGEQVQSVRYYNLQGMASDEAFSGMNIVVTTYTSGRVATEKRMF